MKDKAEGLFEKFLKASTCKATHQTFCLLCNELGVEYPPARNATYDHITFYARLKESLGTYWKAESLFAKLDKKYNDDINFNCRKNRDGRARAAKDLNVLIIGAGPCGLRTAIFTALLGAKTVIVEKRDSFSRNNVLHLWPFTIEDLKSLGAKKFNGRFCSGAIDHVSIRQLQLILTKAALIFGVEVHFNNAFIELTPPVIEGMTAWKAKIDPEFSPVNDFEFNMVVGADGRKNTLHGFKKKVFRGSLAIGITVNFIHTHSSAEAQVPEISGINFIYRQEFFRALNMEHNIDLENIVYYKDDTHYFVMTARKQSLLQRGVFRENLDEPRDLVHGDNIDQKALLEYALDAVNFSTENKLPDLEVAINTYGLPDIALFDFTCMKSSVNASMFHEVNGVKLLKALVGDGLMEPFWPKGTGIGKGFLAAFDASWMLRQWALGIPLDKTNDQSLEMGLLAERESLYRTLAQVESNKLVKKYSLYTIDPRSRYQFVPRKLDPGQVRSFYITDGKEPEVIPPPEKEDRSIVPSRLTRQVSFVKSNKLQQWCEKVLRESGASVLVTDMSSSWKDGYALCTLIYHYRPDIIDLDQLQSDNFEHNNQLAFDAAEEHLGITPIMSGKEMAECEVVDDLVMVTYLSQFYEVLKYETPVKPVKRVSDIITTPPEDSLPKPYHKKKSPFALLTKISQQIKRKSIQRNSSKEYGLESHDTKRRKTFAKRDGEIAQSGSRDVVLTKATLPTIPDEDKENTVAMRMNPRTPGVQKSATNRISALGLQLISQLEQNSDVPVEKPTKKTVVKNSSSVCYFCGKTVYIVERLSVEGLFFHRQCFKCSHCEMILRPMSYKRDSDSGKFYCSVHYFAHAEYLKQPKASSKTPEARNLSLPEIEVEEVADGNGNISASEHSSLRSPTLDLSLHTIEHGQVVIKRDATPKRTDMENMAMFISSAPIEIGEEVLYEHNMRCSHNSESDEDSDSEAEELDELANKLSGLKDMSVQEFMSEYHRKRESSITKTSDSAFLSSSSEGDDDVGSLSSTSADSSHMKESVFKETRTDQHQLVEINGDHADLQDDGDLASLSTVSTEENDNEPDDVLGPNERYHEGIVGRKDTLESTERFLLEHPIQGECALSSASSCEEPAIGHEEDLAIGHEEDLVKLLRKDTLDSAEQHIRDHPVNISRYLSSSSSDAEENEKEEKQLVHDEQIKQDIVMSSNSSDEASETIDEENATLAKDFRAQNKTEHDTTVWAGHSSDAVDGIDFDEDFSMNACMEGDGLSIHDIDRVVEIHDEVEGPILAEKSASGNLEIIASTPKFSPFVPSDNDIFATPCADHLDQESFHTVKSDQSWNQDISSYVSASVLDSTIDSSSTINDSNTSETPQPRPSVSAPRPGRRLPETPKIPGRRRLPVIPHLEALSTTTSEVSPRQRSRIEQKLKKHEVRVIERIRKMKLGLDPRGSRESSEQVTRKIDSGAVERDDFVKDIPLLLEKRNNALMRKKLKHGKSAGENRKAFFHFGTKKKVRKDRVSPPPLTTKVMSPTHRSSRQRDLSSYTREEIDNRVSQRVRLAEQRQAQEAERKRMAQALVLQQQLQEVDAKQKQLEERGVELEKLLRNQSSQGVRPRDSSLHMHEWFKLVQEKNALLRYENELGIHQRELQLEDRQSRLQQEYRKCIAMDDSKKSDAELAKEKNILSEMMEVIDQRDQLVALLDEQRVQDKEESTDVQQVLMNKFMSIDSSLMPPL